MGRLLSRVVGLFSDKSVDAPEIVDQPRIAILKFDASVVTQDIEQLVYEAILRHPNLADSAPSTLRAIHLAAMKGIRRGGDHYTTRIGIEEVLPDLKKGQVLSLVNHLHRVASVSIQIKKDVKSGFEEADWRYCGAPCYTRKTPSEEERKTDNLHKSLDGKRFKLRDGILVGNRHYWPGLEGECGCYYRPILKGYND